MAGALIFFYGSLLLEPAEARVQRALAACRPLGGAWIQGRLYDLGHYPGAVPSPRHGDRIRGELYQLRDTGRSLRLLDRFEDYHRRQPADSLYLRRRTTAWLNGGGRAVACWAYFYNGPVRSRWRIPDGDYRRYLQRRQR
ncbi:MAG: gamma-glutamylcyclotransferase [Gammaproteobacteria bacterium]